MHENSDFKSFKTYLLDQNFTADQAKALTVEDIKQITGKQKLSDNFINNLKQLAVEKLIARQDSDDLDFVKQQLKPLLEKFPDLTADMERLDGKRIIRLYPDGPLDIPGD
ncbi:MAG: hypothetical protein JW912_07585 [Sedimentisphaerales bacterium]|nr:hypothetical protein [Sedimentisphaerales bacterium]